MKRPRIPPSLIVFAPTALGIAIDIILRGRSLWDLSVRGKVGYLASSFLGVGFWFALLYAMAHVARLGWEGDRRRGARITFVAVFIGFVFPFAIFAYGMQAYHVSIFNNYMTRDTIRLAIAIRATIWNWVTTTKLVLLPTVLFGGLVAAGLAIGVKRAAVDITKIRPLAPALGFIVAMVVFWRDSLTASEWLQSPDASLQGAFVGFARDTFRKRAPQGLTYRQGVVVAPSPPAERRPNILLIITESLRADMMCAEKTPSCASRFLDDAIPDRIGLTRMTAQTSGTVTSCMTMWTGLSPEATIEEAHAAPLIWEVAKAAGYRTAYIASQDLRANKLGPYLANAGIDVQVTASDFGGVEEIHIGCPDERATARMLQLAREEKGPWLAVLHISNTHYPFRVDPELQPFTPHDDSPIPSSLEALRNHMKNAALLQERTVSAFYRDLRALPIWDDTITIFTSDHGDQLREHGALFHLNSLFEEEIRVPAWVTLGSRAVSPEQEAALRSTAKDRLFLQDLHATLLDLLAARLPSHAKVRGHSLLGAKPPTPPIASMSTASGVWFDDDPVYGVLSEEMKVLGTDTHEWVCYDLAKDPGEHHRLAAAQCRADLVAEAAARFPHVPRSP